MPDLDPTEADDLARMVRDTAERLFVSGCDRAVIDRAAHGTWPETLWARAEENGLTLAALPEEAGGTGLGLRGALPLVRIAGRHAAPIPLGDTIVAAWLANLAGFDVPEGPLAFAVADSRDDRALRLAASGNGSSRLTGEAPRIPWGRKLAALLVAVPDGPSASSIALLRPGEWTLAREGINVANEPRDTLRIDTTLGADAFRPVPLGRDAIRALGAAIRTAAMAGALARIGELTLGYAGDRVQFGRPLSKFQAIQHSLAIIGTQIAAAGAAAEMAGEALAEVGPDGAERLLPAAGIAKARAGEAATIAVPLAHQIHGAIGFTAEYDLQVFTKRLWAWRDEFGAEREWNTRFGRHLLQAGPDRLWAEITAAA